MNNIEIEKHLREIADCYFTAGSNLHKALLAAADIVADYDEVCGFLADAADGRIGKLMTERDELRAKVASLELTITALEGEMGYAVPSGVELPEVKPNAIADTLAAENARLREALEELKEWHDEPHDSCTCGEISYEGVCQQCSKAVSLSNKAEVALAKESNEKSSYPKD